MLVDDFIQLREGILAWRRSRTAFQEELARETRNRHEAVRNLLHATAVDLAAGRRAWRGDFRSTASDSQPALGSLLFGGHNKRRKKGHDRH